MGQDETYTGVQSMRILDKLRAKLSVFLVNNIRFESRVSRCLGGEEHNLTLLFERQEQRSCFINRVSHYRKIHDGVYKEGAESTYV